LVRDGLQKATSWLWCQAGSGYTAFCQIPELKEQPKYYSQKASLTQLKVDRPWYKEIHSQVLQEVSKKVEITFERWLKGDSNGKKSGRPRFKGVGQYKTFT
jgi:putative transposase